ncbi:MAG: hypothetical protein H0W12_06365, partial [Chitinophagaceae bacterium]|nr:hypothetical protein [Chitinophagaceae bacterium]
MHRIVLISPLILLYFSSIAQPNEMNISYDSSAQVHAFDSTAKLRVNQIIITGNRKTKDYIILREMHIKAGDMIKIDKLNYELEKAKEYVYNTTLFVEVTVEPLVKNAFEIDILVTVKERWYIFPLPIFELVDRTFNEWIVKHNGSLDRVNYGLRFTDNNVSGRKDEFRLNLINGYTKQASIYYDQPYANPSLTNGFNVGAGFEKNREMAYKTDYNNYFQYYNKPGFVEDSWFVSAGFAIRKAIKKKHIFNLRYSHITVADSVITENLNPRYFNTNSSGKGFIDFSYSYRYTDVNNILYPLSGVSGSFTIQKRGLGLRGGINMFSVDGSYNRYWG